MALTQDTTKEGNVAASRKEEAWDAKALFDQDKDEMALTQQSRNVNEFEAWIVDVLIT